MEKRIVAVVMRMGRGRMAPASITANITAKGFKRSSQRVARSMKLSKTEMIERSRKAAQGLIKAIDLLQDLHATARRDL